ncbi:MAG: ABC transporter permease [Planctomycetes bacterium]|nr:ABC transporter permease [Planctomycetota bacterium]
MPTNPFLAQFGNHAVPDQIEQQMEEHGWNDPIYEQAGDFLQKLIIDRDLGNSFFIPAESVSEGLWRTFPATIELALAALVLAIPIGVLAGIAAAVWRNRPPDYLCMIGSLLGVSVPVFFLGICLMLIFTDMPTGRRMPFGMNFTSHTGFIVLESFFRGRFDVTAAALRHLVLPALALSSIPMAVIARVTRSSMLEVLSADYVRTARAKGASLWRVVMRHALPNASIPVANIAGLQIGFLLGGAVLTETVFDWPGLGRHLVTAVLKSDYNVVQGCTLLVAVLFVSINLLLDVVYVWLDPRVGRAAEDGQ